MAIFFSVAILVGVFLRRYFLFSSLPSKDTVEDDAEEDAMDDKRRFSREDHEKTETLLKRGESLLKVGKDEDAIKCFVQILSIAPVHSEAQNKLALLYLQKQMFGAAAALFKQLSETSPDPVHFSHLGLALFSQSDFENAKIAYQKALELDSSRPQRFVSLSHVYRSLGQLYHAVVALNKALELEEDHPEVLLLLADLHIELQKTPNAKYFLSRILEIDPKNPEAKKILKNLESSEL